MLDATGTTTHTFDNNGNQRTEQTPGGPVTTNIWDYENHLTIIEQPAVNNITYAYSHNGLRVEKNTQGTITKFVWDDQAYLAETDNSDVTSVVYSNEPSAYGDLISQRKGGNTNFFLFDALGSTRELTAADESITDTLIYDAWGNKINRTGTTNIDFQYVGSQGYYRDAESDLFYVRARLLKPSLAIWMTEDPARFSEETNFFRYVHNNPIIAIDPSGRWALKCRRITGIGWVTFQYDCFILCNGHTFSLLKNTKTGMAEPLIDDMSDWGEGWVVASNNCPNKCDCIAKNFAGESGKYVYDKDDCNSNWFAHMLLKCCDVYMPRPSRAYGWDNCSRFTFKCSAPHPGPGEGGIQTASEEAIAPTR